MPYSPRSLPSVVSRLFEQLHVPDDLLTHLEIVHDTAVDLLRGLALTYPAVPIEASHVLFGAATHDIGKLVHKNEIQGPGRLHERDGPLLLSLLGVSPSLARFAGTHGRWSPASSVEDLIVSLADQIWKGRRHDDLVTLAAEHFSRHSGCSSWHAFIEIDDLLADIASPSQERLEYVLRRMGVIVSIRRTA